MSNYAGPATTNQRSQSENVFLIFLFSDKLEITAACSMLLLSAKIDEDALQPFDAKAVCNCLLGKIAGSLRGINQLTEDLTVSLLASVADNVAFTVPVLTDTHRAYVRKEVHERIQAT